MRFGIVGAAALVAFAGQAGLVGALPLARERTDAPASGFWEPDAQILGGALLPLAPMLAVSARRKGPPATGRDLVAVLRNPTRRRTLKLIQARPGIQPYHIWQEVGGAPGVIQRALERLEAVGLVQTLKMGGSRHYYENAPRFNERTMELYAHLATKTIGEMFRTLLARREATQREISEDLDLSVSSVSERLARMVEVGLVRFFRRENCNVYAPSDLPLPRGYWGPWDGGPEAPTDSRRPHAESATPVRNPRARDRFDASSGVDLSVFLP